MIDVVNYVPNDPNDRTLRLCILEQQAEIINLRIEVQTWQRAFDSVILNPKEVK